MVMVWYVIYGKVMVVVCVVCGLEVAGVQNTIIVVVARRKCWHKFVVE